ncbi:unnamed protein product [Dicrocoelium dendriticum]|nr:unnamed protein product [Dicrocoelium dendriticum]
MTVIDTSLDSIQNLVEKLDNPIDEIRFRALAAISSKLQRELLVPDERTSVALAEKSLDWLNKSPLLNSLDILKILQFLVAKESVRQTVIRASGLAILARVRNQLPVTSIRDLIDDILRLISGGEIFAPDSSQHVVFQQPAKWIQPSGYFNFTGSSILSTTSAFSNTQSQSWKWFLRSKEPYIFPSCTSNSNVCAVYDVLSHSQPSTSISHLSAKHVFSFPFLPLTKTDSDVIRASLDSIKSTDPEVALTGIKFFQDVVLEDFVAEIFLQRPAITETLLRLLTCVESSLAIGAADALTCLCEKVINRVYFHLDPNNYSTAFGTSPPFIWERSYTDTVSNRISSSQNTSNPATTSSAPSTSIVPGSTHHLPSLPCAVSELRSHTDEAIERPCSFSIPDFCIELLREVGCGLLATVDQQGSGGGHNPLQGEHSNRRKFNKSESKLNLEAKLLQLMWLSIRLLLVSTSPIELAKPMLRREKQSTTWSTLWNWMFQAIPLDKDVLNPYELPKGFPTCLEPWSQLLSLLTCTWNDSPLSGHSSVGWNFAEITKQTASASLPHTISRHVYLTALGNLYYLISSLFTPETALCILPVDLRNQLSLSLLDIGLLFQSESASGELEGYGLPAYVALFNAGIFKTWQLLTLLGQSMTQLVRFLSAVDSLDPSDGSKMLSEETLNLAVEGLDSVDIVGSNRFASEFVRFLNKLSMNDCRLTSTVLWRGQLVLLRLLSHPIVSVRKAAFTQLRDVIQHATDPRVVSDPLQQVNPLEFVLRDEVLCELLEFGLTDDCIEIRTLAEQLLCCLLDSYDYLPQSSWRTLRRLCMEPASSNTVGIRYRPLNIILGVYATAESSSTAPTSFGKLALDWCLGHMTPAGRTAAFTECLQSSAEDTEITEHTSSIQSCCRLLFHRNRAVRSVAGLVMARRLRKFVASRASPSAGTSSSLLDARLVTGMSTVVEVSEASGTNTRQTSTPVELCCADGQLIPALIDCLIYPQDETGASQPLPFVLDHIDRIGCEPTDTEQVDGLVRVVRVFTDDQADLNVRRAAGEQALMLAKHPGAALAWLSNEGLTHFTQWLSRLLHSWPSTSTKVVSPELPKPTVTSVSIARVLLPVSVRILRFVAVWSTAGRKHMASDKELILNLLYLRLISSGSGGLHEDLMSLMALLLFDPVVREAEECPICLPNAVFTGYLIPFTCPTYSLRSQWRELGSSGTVSHSPFQPLLDLLSVSNSDEQTRIFQSMIRRGFRICWSFASHGGLASFIKHTLSVLGVLPSDCVQVDSDLVDICFKRCRDYTPFLGQLSMSSSDLSLVLFSQWDASVLLCLAAAQHATNHGSLVKAISILHRCCAMCACAPASGFVSDMLNSTSSCCWWSCGQLERFLSTLPACSADFQLLTSLLHAIEQTGLLSSTPLSISFGTTLELCQWLFRMLVDDRGALSYCLLQPSAGVGETDSRRLISAKRHLVYYHLPRLLYQLTERLASLERSSSEFRRFWSAKSHCDHSGTDESAPNRSPCSTPTQFFRICLRWSLNALVQFTLTPFSDLVRLRFVLGVLCNLTSSALWMSEFDLLWLPDLLIVSTHLLTRFDSGREEANASFMGLGSLRLLLLLINQVLQQILEQPTLLDLIVSENQSLNLSGNVPSDLSDTLPRAPWYTGEWILRCLVYRSVEVRSLALSLLGRIALVPIWAKGFSTHSLSAETRGMLLAHGLDVPSSGGRLWAIALAVLLNRKEAILCRIQALQLLTNLTSIPIDPRDSGIFLPQITDATSRQNITSEQLRPTPLTENLAPAESVELSAIRQHNVVTASNHGQEHGVLWPAAARGLVAEGDRPSAISESDDRQSSVIDLRELFDSEIGSSDVQQRFSALVDYLRPLFENIHVETNETARIRHSQRHTGTGSSRFERPWLLHTMPIPRDTLLPCYYDSNCGLHLLGLPALHQLLITRSVFLALHEILSSYLPQPLLDPLHWNQLVGVTTCLTSTIVDTTESSTPNHQSAFGHSHPTSIQTQDLHPKILCTPLMVTAVCQLLSNLLHQLPKLVLAESSRLRINSLLMNIVDPTLLEAFLTANSAASCRTCSNNGRVCMDSWSTTAGQLISAFSACLRVLRCQAAMHNAFRAQLASDARFLAQLIRSLKYTDSIDLLAPLWRELFVLLTYVLLPSDDTDADDLRFRLILQPLASQVDAVLLIALGMMDRSESELVGQCDSPQRKNDAYYCKISRSTLDFITVALSCHRPLSSNPILLKMESQASSTQTLVASFTRRLISLTSANSSDSQPDKLANSTKRPFVVHLTTKLPASFTSYRRALLATLRTLLGVCRSAKAVALEDNLLEQLMLNMKLVQAKMDFCFLSAQTGTPTIERRHHTTWTWNTLSDDLVSKMEIVHNLIYVYSEARRRVVDAGFAQFTQRLWPLALQDDRILHSLLSLLTNLTADCPYASASLVSNPNAIPSGSISKVAQEERFSQAARDRGPSGAMLYRGQSTPTSGMYDAPGASAAVQSLVQLLYRLVHPMLSHGSVGNTATQLSSSRFSTSTGKLSPAPQSINEVTLRFVFQLLANMMWAAEARCALLKTKLLHHFTELDTRVMCKSRRGQFTLTLWLQLLVSLSFTRDGQQILFGQSRIPEVLVSCVSHSKGHNRERALLAMRNLCTSTTLKSQLLSGDSQMLGCINDILISMTQNEQCLDAVSLAVSSLLALVYGNQKVRVLIRSAGCLHLLTNIWSACQRLPDSMDLVPKIQKLIAQLQK